MGKLSKKKSIKITAISPENSEMQELREKNTSVVRSQRPTRKGQTIVYNPDNMPPDFNAAIVHKKATMVGQEKNYDLEDDDAATAIDIDEQYCRCCARKTDKEKFGLCCGLDDLAYLGPGYPLYFDFIKFCAFLLFSIFLSSGAFNLFTNYYYGTDCQKSDVIQSTDNECYLDWVTQYSLGNKKSETQLMEYQNYVNIGSILILIIMFQFFRNHVKKVDIKYDIIDINPKDYSIWISNIPINYRALNDDYDDDLQNFIEEQIYDGEPKFKIDCINLCYNMKNVKSLQKDKMKSIKEKAEILWFQHNEGYFKPGRTIGMINTEINEYQRQIDEYLNQFYEGQGQAFMAQYFAGQAFVSFSDPSAREYVVTRYGNISLCDRRTPMIYHGKKLVIRDAPDPLNINWENLNVKSQSIREAISYIFTLALVGTAFFSVYYYLQYKETISKDISDQIILFAITFVASCIINGFNFLILVLGKKFTTAERQQSKTMHNISAIKKIALGQFLVTAWIIYAIDIILGDETTQTNYGKTFKKEGLAYNSTVVIIGNTIIPFMTELTEIKLIFKKMKQWKVRRFYRNNIPLLKTQEELNKIFENADVNIIVRYTLVLKTMYLVSFYAAILPTFLLWGMLSLFLTYWIDKYNILRRRSVLDSLSTELAIEMIEMLEYCIILYTLGNLAAMVYILEIIEYSLMSVLRSWPAYGVFLGILHAALPMQWVNERIFNLPDNPPNIQTYEQAQSQFLTDYQRTNPATAEIAKQQHFKKINKQQKQNLEKRRQSKFQDMVKVNQERLRRASVRPPSKSKSGYFKSPKNAESKFAMNIK